MMNIPRILKRITRAVATASQLLVAAPVRLPSKVMAVAKYAALGAALLEAFMGEEEEEGLQNHLQEPVDPGGASVRPQQSNQGEEALNDEP